MLNPDAYVLTHRMGQFWLIPVVRITAGKVDEKAEFNIKEWKAVNRGIAFWNEESAVRFHNRYHAGAPLLRVGV